MNQKSIKLVILVAIISMLVCIVMYLKSAYSPVKTEFGETVKLYAEELAVPKTIITENDLKALPEVLQVYFIKNGYLGIETASAVKFDFKDANFSLGIDKPIIKIDYTVFDFIKDPVRIALIDSKMYGIPFQGIDSSKDGEGFMKGVIAKHIPIFNEHFDFLDCAYLAECLTHPSLALQKSITYRKIDEYRLEATIRKNNSETTGVFHFNEKYEMTRFVAENRYCSETKSYERWSAITDSYQIIDGRNMPTKFQGVWNFTRGDLLYFDGNDMKISFQ